MIKGLLELGTTLNLTQVTAPSMQTNLDGYVASESDYNTARSALQAAYVSFHAADAPLTAWLNKAASVLTTFFGKRWNPMWAQAGFINNSTTVPTTIDGRLGLALRLITFFTGSPAYEVAALGVTAAAGTAARAAAVTTQQAVGTATSTVKQRQADRELAQLVLATQMRMLIKILTGLLGADDPRWKEFGLNIPSADTTPTQPQNVVVSPDLQAAPVSKKLSRRLQGIVTGASSQVLASCEAVPLATRYRFRMRVAGLGVPYTLITSTPVPLAVITVPQGVAVEIIVQAVNGGLQGLPSEPVIYTALTTAEKTTAPKTIATPAVRNGNGAVTTATNGISNGTNGTNGHPRHATA
jgi:hypothetical protein